MRRFPILVRLLAVLAYMFVMTAMPSPTSRTPEAPRVISIPADPI